MTAVALTLMVAGLAGFFAWRQNPSERPRPADATEDIAAPAAPPPDAELLSRGAGVFERSGCLRCHGVDGVGNPRAPLDGVGARRSVTELRAWVTATGSAADQLSRSAVRAKSAFIGLPPEEMEALLAYLSALR